MPHPATTSEPDPILAHARHVLHLVCEEILHVATAHQIGQPLPIKRDHIEQWRSALMQTILALSPPNVGVYAGPGGLEKGDPVQINDAGQAVPAITRRAKPARGDPDAFTDTSAAPGPAPARTFYRQTATTGPPPLPTPLDEDLAALLTIAKRPAVDINLRSDSALAILAMLQLALRHPGTHDSQVEGKAIELKEILIHHLAADDPHAAKLLRRGDNPNHDSPAFQQIHQNEPWTDEQG